MPYEAKKKCDSAAYQDCSGKYVPYDGNADEKYQHTAESENRSGDAAANQ
jgi:hypothetical protein